MSLNEDIPIHRSSSEEFDQESSFSDATMKQDALSNLVPQASNSINSRTSYLEVSEFGQPNAAVIHNSHRQFSNESESLNQQDTSEVQVEPNSGLAQELNSGLVQDVNSGLSQTFSSDARQEEFSAGPGGQPYDSYEPSSKPFNTSQNKNEGEEPEVVEYGSPVDPSRPNYESYYKYDTTGNVPTAAYPYQWGSTASRMEANRAMRNLSTSPAAYSKHAFTVADLPHLDDRSSAGSFSRISSARLDRKYSTSYGPRNSLMDFDALNSRVSSATMDINGTIEERIKMMSKVLEDIKHEGTSVDFETETRESVDYENGYTTASYVSRIPSVYGSLNVEKIRLKTLNDLLNTTPSFSGNLTDKMWLPPSDSKEAEGYVARVNSRGSSTDYTKSIFGRPAWGVPQHGHGYGSKRGSTYSGDWSSNKSVGQSYSNPYVTAARPTTLTAKSKTGYYNYRHVAPKVSSFRRTPSSMFTSGAVGRRHPSQRSSSTGRYSSAWDKTPSFSKFKESNWNVNKSASKPSQPRTAARNTQAFTSDQQGQQQVDDRIQYAPILHVAQEPYPEPEPEPETQTPKQKPAALKKRKSKFKPYVPMENRTKSIAEQGMWERVDQIFDRVIDERNDLEVITLGEVKHQHEDGGEEVHEYSDGVGGQGSGLKHQHEDGGGKVHDDGDGIGQDIEPLGGGQGSGRQSTDKKSDGLEMHPSRPSEFLPERLEEFMKKIHQSRLQSNESFPEQKREPDQSLDQQNEVVVVAEPCPNPNSDTQLADYMDPSEYGQMTKTSPNPVSYADSQQGLEDIANSICNIGIESDKNNDFNDDARSISNNNEHQETVTSRAQPLDESNNRQGAEHVRVSVVPDTPMEPPLPVLKPNDDFDACKYSVSSKYTIPTSHRPASHVYSSMPYSDNSSITSAREVWTTLKRGTSDSAVLSDKQVRRFIGLLGASEAENNIPGWRKKKSCSSIGGMFFTPLIRNRETSKRGGSWNDAYTKPYTNDSGRKTKLDYKKRLSKFQVEKRRPTNQQIHANALHYTSKL